VAQKGAAEGAHLGGVGGLALDGDFGVELGEGFGPAGMGEVEIEEEVVSLGCDVGRWVGGQGGLRFLETAGLVVEGTGDDGAKEGRGRLGGEGVAEVEEAVLVVK
jgi:hypothetical protein